MIHTCDVNSFSGTTLAQVLGNAAAWAEEHGNKLTVLAINVDYDQDKDGEHVTLSLFHEGGEDERVDLHD